MSKVVLRCPKCGTSQNQPGECDACYEAQVRYFCTNHVPGRWLDAPVCEDCGQKFGEAPKPPPVPSAPLRAPTRTNPRTPARPMPPPVSRTRVPGAIEPSRTPHRRVPEPDSPRPEPTLADALDHLLRARRGRAPREPSWEEPTTETRMPPPRTNGCLVKLLILAAIVAAFWLGVPMLLLGGLFQFL